MSGPADSGSQPSTTGEDLARRTFFARLSMLLGGAVTAALAAGPIAMLLHPVLGTRRANAPDDWTPVGPVSSFMVGAPPRRVVLTEDREDAWLRQPGVPVGSVLVQRQDEAAFTVFSAVCPHLGCAVGYAVSKSCYLCPCHTSSFTLDGALLPHEDGSPNPSPRGLDPLAWRVQGGQLQVQWVRFKTGTADRTRLG